MNYLSVEEVIQIHDELVEEYGGAAGILNLGLLISAVNMPKATMFQQDLHPSLFNKAAAYLFHIVLNHCFVDGNKRTGVAACLIFLENNGHTADYDLQILESLVVDVAKGDISKLEISSFLEGKVQGFSNALAVEEEEL